MDTHDIHYLSFDPDAIWEEIQLAFIAAGGDVLYPGDEKEILLRSVLAVITQVFAGVDNALRMDTLRYAVGDYLDLYGEKRNCVRIAASAAAATVQIHFQASGQAKTIPAGTTLTALDDGMLFYALSGDIRQTGLEQTVTASIRCTQTGSLGNGLLSGTQMQFAVPNAAVTSIVCASDASGGNDKEDDETYRARIRQYGLVNITTGPAIQYQSKAMSVSSEILDAKALNLGAGNVGIYLILESDVGAAAILDAVEAALNTQDTRPLTDLITVAEAAEVTYTLHVQYSADSDSDVEDAIAAAVVEFAVWQDNKIGRAFNPDKLMAALYQAGATRVLWGTGSEFDGGAVTYTEIDADTRCKGTIDVAVITP